MRPVLNLPLGKVIVSIEGKDAKLHIVHPVDDLQFGTKRGREGRPFLGSRISLAKSKTRL